MPIDFTPNFITDYPLGDFTPKRFMLLALETAKTLIWEVDYLSACIMVAYINHDASNMRSKVTIKILRGNVNIHCSSATDQHIDIAIHRKSIQAFFQQFETLNMTLSDENLEALYPHLDFDNNCQDSEEVLIPETTQGANLNTIFGIFLPVPGYFITPILINLNILIFILMLFDGVHILSPDTESLIQWGANFKPLTLAGEAWRLFTCCFIHIGIMHLLMNMYALMFVGILLEPYLGKIRLSVAYVLTGLVASMTSLWWHDDSVSAGASGAIFGLYGLFLAMLTTKVIEKSSRKQLLSSIGLFVIYNLGMGLRGNTDNAAHIGGLLSGLLIGYAFIPALKKKEDQRLNQITILALSIAFLLGIFFVYRNMPNDAPKYNSLMQSFTIYETAALKAYDLPDDATPGERYEAYAGYGIENWNKALNVLDEVEKLNLSALLQKRTDLLQEYCNTRIKAYSLSADTNSTQYNRYLIDTQNKKVDSLVRELNALTE
ncbi:MAG: rhomboid family intramembrane serine protease [Chitinophagaceae bacterium]|nr:rhomboid family intramembrane serine protease [Chitinophagaceae bacterium]